MIATDSARLVLNFATEPYLPSLERTAESLLSCAAFRPIRCETADQGAHESVRIEPEQGITMILRFRSAILPELVEGMVRVP